MGDNKERRRAGGNKGESGKAVAPAGYRPQLGILGYMIEAGAYGIPASDEYMFSVAVDVNSVEHEVREEFCKQLEKGHFVHVGNRIHVTDAGKEFYNSSL